MTKHETEGYFFVGYEDSKKLNYSLNILVIGEIIICFGTYIRKVYIVNLHVQLSSLLCGCRASNSYGPSSLKLAQ